MSSIKAVLREAVARHERYAAYAARPQRRSRFRVYDREGETVPQELPGENQANHAGGEVDVLLPSVSEVGRPSLCLPFDARSHATLMHSGRRAALMRTHYAFGPATLSRRRRPRGARLCLVPSIAARR